MFAYYIWPLYPLGFFCSFYSRILFGFSVVRVVYLHIWTLRELCTANLFCPDKIGQHSFKLATKQKPTINERSRVRHFSINHGMYFTNNIYLREYHSWTEACVVFFLKKKIFLGKRNEDKGKSNSFITTFYLQLRKYCAIFWMKLKTKINKKRASNWKDFEQLVCEIPMTHINNAQNYVPSVSSHFQ